MERSFYICKCNMIFEKEVKYISKGEIGASSDVVEIAKEMGYAEYAEEYFGMICVNAVGKVVHYSEVSHGDLCSTATHPREIFKRALLSNAGSVVFIHNHPSGNITPSETDMETTKRLVKVGEIIGIPVLDHIIIGENYSYYSMRAHGDI